MSFINGIGYLFETVGGYSTPEILYAVNGNLSETHEMVGLGRFDTDAPSSIGWFAGILGAIGESDNKIGGYRVTRLMDPISAGDDIFPVESAQDWPDAGQVAIDGVVYSYTGKGPGRISGVTHLFHGG